MSGDAEAGSPRPRPLSGGFWTLLSWLRGEDHSSSNESLSSAGSDRTAISFAFLAPAHYRSGAPPVVLPAPGPPTDSYKRRVRERNLRRQYDRDTTLHRKYGLFRGEGGGGYDAFSLPPARRCSGERAERERRATSECFQRRAAHVPGKRRAPPPPQAARAAPTAQSPNRPVAASNRRHSRKRPAPQPPKKIIQKSKENIVSRPSSGDVIQMSARSVGDHSKVKCADVSLETDCKPEKCTKKDPRDSKIRSEKSFLKQIFDNKKRNSTVDISTVKLLPSISELDKQAAEIIENNKLKNILLKSSRENDIGCLKCPKGSCLCNSLVIPPQVMPSSSTDVHHKIGYTIYTQTENDLLSKSALNKKVDEKQKLKEMLKEMKDSLPKRPKHEVKVEDTRAIIKSSPKLSERNNNITDTPTLRIGFSSSDQVTKSVSPAISTAKDKLVIRSTQNAKPMNSIEDKQNITSNKNKVNRVLAIPDNAMIDKQPETSFKENKKLHTPLKISTLLNPIYIPKDGGLIQNHTSKTLAIKQKNEDTKIEGTALTPDPIYVKTADAVRDIVLNTALAGLPIPTTSQPLQSEKSLPCSNAQQPSNPKEVCINDPKPLSKLISSADSKTGNNIERLSEHSRRRELVNQLEQSIAKGDERAAAEAATKLAQLRLSCSVLSFSSQILGQPSTSSPKLTQNLISANEKTFKQLGNETNGNKIAEALPVLNKVQIESSKIKTDQSSKGKVPQHKKDASTSPIAQINQTKLDTKVSTVQASTSRDMSNNPMVDNMTSIQVWIEDKEKARGPIQLHVRREASVGDLRRQAEQYLGLPARLQRWIVGRTLCTHDDTRLISLAGPTFNTPFYLCLVESDPKNMDVNREQNETKKEISNNKPQEKKGTSDVYSELVNLERQALVPNTESFECEICMEQCAPGNGAVLRECVHSFCRDCLSDVIRHCEEPTVGCPATGCSGELHEREIRALVSVEEYQRWLARGLAAAESGTRNAFHCRTRDCTGWALCEIDVRRFPCPVCKHINCVPCKAVHENQTCEQYQAKLREETAVRAAEIADGGTQALIDSLISRGEALQCPECSAVITKKWGCDWVKCSACKTEICWVTRGRRWGPGGRGDTTGGCRCGIDGKKCHPSCGYCH